MANKNLTRLIVQLFFRLQFLQHGQRNSFGLVVRKATGAIMHGRMWPMARVFYGMF